MTTKTDTITLPPFPDTITKLPIDHDGNGPLVWKDDEVRAYARAAVEADRQSQPAISDMQLHCILQVYDDALDKAREGRVFDNPGRPGSLEARAWDAGTQRGKELGPITQPAASAEPVEINIDRVLSIADAHANESREDGVRLLDRGGLFAFAQDVLRVAVPVAAQPSVREDVIYLGCARMGIAGASDEEVLSYVRVALRNATPPAAEQASIQQWPSDWADQLNGEYRQGLEDGRKEAQLSGNPVQLVSVQVDRSSNLQGSRVDKSTEMQDQPSAQDREDADRYRYLRTENAKPYERDGCLAVVYDDEEGGAWVGCDLDAAIDAARKEQP